MQKKIPLVPPITGLMPAMSLDSTNLFKIGGGFTGHVYQFKLFSPGMHIMSSRQKFFFSFSSKSLIASCSTNGKADFGITSSSPITSLFTCDASCNECSDATNTGCMSCSTASYGILDSVCSACTGNTYYSSSSVYCQSKNQFFILIFIL